MSKIGSILVCSFLVLAEAQADELVGVISNNWRQWRGPSADGVSAHGDPPVKWDERTNIKWKSRIPGEGSATPIVWGNQVFVLTAIETDRIAKDPPQAHPDAKTLPPQKIYEFAVVCIDRVTGKDLWKKTACEDVPHEGRHSTNSYASASPTTDGERLYVSFGSRGVFCFDLRGKQLWMRDLGDMRTRSGWGEATSPVVHGDSLIVNWDHEDDSFIVNLDAKTGETKWNIPRDEPTSWATPLVVNYQGRDQVIVNGTNRVRSYDLASGKVLWECGGQTVNAIPSPIRFEDNVICMSGYRGQAAYSIPLDSTGDLTGTDKIGWHHGRNTPYVPSPILCGDLLYFTRANSAVLTCLNAKTGETVFDAQRLGELGNLYASPVAAKNRIYFVDRDGTTLVIKQDKSLEVIATNKLNEPIDASPVIVGRQMFLRGKDHLYCIEEATRTAHYLQQTETGFRPESEIQTETSDQGSTVTSTTKRGETTLTIRSHYNAADTLMTVSVAVATQGHEKSATVTVADGTARIARDGKEAIELECPTGVIVTSAPDWTDAYMIARRYDVAQGGLQKFSGLWVHPTNEPLRLTFEATHLGQRSVKNGKVSVKLEELSIALRNQSRYLGWINERGELVRLVPAGNPTRGIVLDGWQDAVFESTDSPAEKP